jgi:integrase
MSRKKGAVPTVTGITAGGCILIQEYDTMDENQRQLAPYRASGRLSLREAGQAANEFAERRAFDQYQQTLDPTTLTRQQGDLALFSLYLADAGIEVSAAALFSDPTTWAGMTHGLLTGFVQWMLLDGYAIGSINVRLTTVRVYAKLAGKAGVLSGSDVALIEQVKGYRKSAGENADAKREKTRKGAKKAQPVPLSPDQIISLKGSQTDHAQGRRDTLLMCLLLDHGLRCGEIESLILADVRLSEGLLTFRREKVKLVQRHKLSTDTMVALYRYLEVCKPEGRLLMGSRKGKGGLMGAMSKRAITSRVRVLGKRLLGVEALSAHDCRHAWVERALRGGTGIRVLQQAGGWSTPIMPLRYAGDMEIANEGVRLG